MSLFHRHLGGRVSPGSLAELEELRRTGADLRGAILRDLDLSGARLAGVDLSGADLTGATLRDADLAGARLERALAQGADLRGANLSGALCEWAVFGAARLDEADFRRAVGARASLVGATARRARFDDADLTFARLASADLRGARFDSAIVQRCIVRASDARGASLDAATGTPTIDRTRRGALDETEAASEGAVSEGGATEGAASAARSGERATRSPMLLAHFMHVVGPFESNAYLMAEDSGAAPALLVDAGGYGPPLRGFLAEKGLRLGAILLTHHHPDHVVALPEILAAHPGIAVFSPAPIAAAPDAHLVREGDRFEAGGFEFEVFRLSGHTPESVGFHCRSAGACYTGDAIFAGSVGGTASDELHAEELSNLRRTVLALPPETELLSGHGPATTVRIELGGNPFLREGFGRA